MFRFSIRELMLMTLVVGLAVAWWVDSATKDAELNNAYEAQVENEGRAVLAESRVKNAKAMIDQLRARLPNSSAPAPNPPKP